MSNRNYILGAIAAWVMVISLHLPRLVAVAIAPEQDFAEVISTHCWNHATITYSYDVNTVTYSGDGSIGDSCATTRTGDKIQMWHSGLWPAASTLKEPKGELERALVGDGVFAVVIILFNVRYCWPGGSPPFRRN